MGMKVQTFDQYDLGHATMKHTTVETNVELKFPDKSFPRRRVTGKSSKELSRWAPGFQFMIAEALQRALKPKEEPGVERTKAFRCLHYAVPLKHKNKEEVLAAIQMLVLRLRRSGMQVQRLHSDLERQFDSGIIRSWCLKENIFQTFVEPEDHQGNGRAEAAIGTTKNKIRQMIAANKDLGQSLWPYAVIHQTEVEWNDFFNLGKHIPKFGAKVMVRTRNQRSDDFTPRAAEGRYLSPIHNTGGAWIWLVEEEKVFAHLHFRRFQRI
jgi:hypothetical protein